MSKLAQNDNSAIENIKDLRVTSKDSKVTSDVEMQKAEKVNLKGEQIDVTQVLDAKEVTLNGGDVNVNAELTAEEISVEGKQIDINEAMYAENNIDIDGDTVQLNAGVVADEGDVTVKAQNGLNMTDDANIKVENGTISLTNNGDALTATNMEAKNVSVTQNGNGDANISNVKADELNVTHNGEGNADVKDTQVTTLNVMHNAVGDVKVSDASGTNMTVVVNDGDMQSTGVNFANTSISLPISRILGAAKEYEYDLADWMRMTLDRDYYDLREGDELPGIGYYDRYDLVQEDSKQQDEAPIARYEGLHNATEAELVIKE